MAAELHGGALHAFGRQRREVLADRNRAGERYFSHRVLRQQMLGDLRGHAEHQIEHARGQPRVGEAAHRLDAGTRRFFRCLENERAARRQRAADFARRREHGKVPRREGGDDADRLRHHQLTRTLDPPGHDAAVAAAALLRVPVDDVGRGDHFGTRLDVDLALLLHQDFRDRVVALAHEVGGLAHDLGAIVGRRRSPQRKAFFRRFERLVEIGLAGMGQVRERLLGRRIEHVLALAAAAVHPLAVDIEREIGIHGTPRWSRDCRDIRNEGISIFRGWIHPSPRLRCHSGRIHPKNVPPFTWMFCPVMKLAPGPQRKRTAAAMSAGSPRRPTSARTSEWCCGSACPAGRGAAITPGVTVLTRILSGASSCASARVKPTSPALAVTTCGRRAAPIWAERPPMLTIAPAPLRLRWGKQALTQLNAPSRMTPVTARQSASVIVSSACSTRTAALLTRMSMRPKREAAAATMVPTASASATSAVTASASPPPRPISAATASASCKFERALTTTAAPPSASASAMARPMLRPAPVTMATRPDSSWVIAILNLVQARGELNTQSAYPRKDERSIFPSNSVRISASADCVRAASHPPWRALSANFSSMSPRVSGSCAPPRICGWRSSITRPSASSARMCPVKLLG